MEEPSQTAQLELAWGSIANLADKISDIEETIEGGWDELIDVVADAMTEEGTTHSTAKAFSYLFNFMYRLLFRLKADPTKRDFNQISKETTEGKEVYRITNYDYKAFKWAKSENIIGWIGDDYIDLPTEKLNDKIRRTLDRRIGE